MRIPIQKGASVHANERVQFTVQPTKNRGGGVIANVPVPADAIWDLTVSSDQLTPTATPVPVALQVRLGGVDVYNGDSAARHAAGIVAGGSDARTFTFNFGPLSVPEVNVRIGIAIRDPQSAKYNTSIPLFSFRLKQGARDMPEDPTPEQPAELPDGLALVGVEVLTEGEAE